MFRSVVARAIAATFMLAAPAAYAHAQVTPGSDAARRDTLNEPSLPRDVARQVIDLYNASGTTRVDGVLDVAADRTIQGDVAVLGGPATVAGHVTGRLLVINADLTLRPGARVDGDVIVVGGVVDGRGQAYLGGELQIHRQVLYFRMEGERLIDDTPTEGESHWWRWRRHLDRRSYATIALTSAHTYNRVEGLPIYVGPTLVNTVGPVRTRFDGQLIYRTSGGFKWDSASVGHRVLGELRLGRERGLTLGARLYDEIAPVESWQLGDAEVGLATFFLHRDFRDYFGRHGGSVSASLFAGDDQSLTVSLADERWASRDERDPFTLFRNNQPWRANPRVDDGRVHVANVTLHVDTRNDEWNPWAGWYLDADFERGTGDFTSFGDVSADLSPLASPQPLAGERDRRPGRRTYSRGFLDVRRYNRLSPEAQLNLRVVLGGWLSGDPLPLERRLSVTGPGALPGFDFRQPASLPGDAGQCAVLGIQPSGAPAQCERVALAQAEFRGALHVGLPFDGDLWDHVAVHTGASWVVFADAGRGWLIGDSQSELAYRSRELPPLSTFLSDLGAGIDFGSGGTADVASFGVYVAKSLSRPSQPANVFVRVRRRF